MVDGYSIGTHFVEFADGTFAEFFKKKLVVTDTGLKKLQIWIRPSKEIIKTYNLKEGEELDARTGIAVKEYNYEDTHICRDDPSYGRIWIFTDFNGNDTLLSLRDSHLKEQIRNLNKQNQSLKITIASVLEEQQKMMSSKKEWMKEVMDVVVEAQRARKRQGVDDEDQGDQDANA